MVLQQLAPELEFVLADGLSEFVHEAFHEDGVLVDVHAAPEARRDVRVAHGVIDQQVGHGVAERVLHALTLQALERIRIHALVFRIGGALIQVSGEERRQDRLARQPDVQGGQVVVFVEAANHLACITG